MATGQDGLSSVTNNSQVVVAAANNVYRLSVDDDNDES